MTPEVAILVPHYQTPILTAHCLERILELTRPHDYELTVIDNGSKDGSGDWLRNRFRDVRVLRREIQDGETAALSHGRALDFGAGATTAPFVVSIHTDTLVLKPDWLVRLLEPMLAGGERAANVAAVGADKPAPPTWRRPGKWLEDNFKAAFAPPRRARRFPRSHFAAFRREALAVRPAAFAPAAGFSPAEELAADLRAAGRGVIVLDANFAARYVLHLNHATLALNDEIGAGDPYVARTRRRALARLQRYFAVGGSDARRAEPRPMSRA
jgi:GT2 family glycosyltransferase